MEKAEVEKLSTENFKESYDSLNQDLVLHFLGVHKDNGPLIEETLRYERDNKKRAKVIDQCENLLKKIAQAEADAKKDEEKSEDAKDAKKDDTGSPGKGEVLGMSDEDTPKPKVDPDEIVTIVFTKKLFHNPEIGPWKWVEHFHTGFPEEGQQVDVPAPVAEVFVRGAKCAIFVDKERTGK